MDQATHCEPSSGSQEGRPLQLQTSEPVISEEDTQELGQVTCIHTVISSPAGSCSFLPKNNFPLIYACLSPTWECWDIHLICSAPCGLKKENKGIAHSDSFRFVACRYT